MADKEFLAALHEQEKLDQLVVDLDLAQYENVVISINGKTGAVVLSTTDINEGTNLYYTNARADNRVALIIDDSITNLLKAWSGQKVTDAISAGSVESAKKWTTPMDFTFSGDLVGSGSFDGSVAAIFSGTVPGKVNNSRVLTDVPANAVFTDTVYDDTTIWDAVNLNTAKVGITAAQASAIEANTAHGTNINNPHLVTAEQVGAEPADPALQAHLSDTEDPHNVTRGQVGLGAVDNTSDLDKPVSTATEAAIQAAINANCLGVGQTWQEFPDRAVDTDYTNDTGKPIMISIIIKGDPAYDDYTWFTLVVDTLEIFTATGDDALTGQETAISGIIPAGSTYSLVNKQPEHTPKKITWNELRG